ncbi:MAG TPA: FG-GAP-like repeat-containing protein [Candidatus Polarisedimenticolia bacterium]|nr:FG-GAP-like repeat-containing protein [Candidatus Polarisedimenticolia bacterium]
MSHPSPHRAKPRRHILLLPVVLGLLAFLLRAGTYPLALPSDGRLPGSISKAPGYVAGFPIPYPRTVDIRPRQGSVVAADIDGDGRPELVVSIPAGQVLVLRADGSRVPGWPRTFEGLTQPAFPVGDPAVGDLDGDGNNDIVTCVVSGTPMRRNFLYALRADGTDLPGWPVELRDGANGYYSCSNIPTLLRDLDGDGRLEVIRGMTRGTIVALDRTGHLLPGWPVRLGPDANGSSREVNADLVTADLNRDGRQELVFVESSLAPRLTAVSYDGRMLSGFPMSLPEIVDRQGPAVADLDGDGNLEIVQATMPYQGDSIEPSPSPEVGPAIPASVHVVRADGTGAPGWPRPLQSGAPWGAVVADIDGDGRQEILQPDGLDLDGFDLDGNALAGFPIELHRTFIASQYLEVSPWVVGDLNGDGERDLLQVWTNLYAGSTTVRVFGVMPSGKWIRGFPFDAAGMLACSRPVLADLSGDGVNDLVMLVGDGANGGWILVAWDLGSRARKV